MIELNENDQIFFDRRATREESDIHRNTLQSVAINTPCILESAKDYISLDRTIHLKRNMIIFTYLFGKQSTIGLLASLLQQWRFFATKVGHGQPTRP